MNSLERSLRALRDDGKKAFVAYFTAGDPNLNISLEVLKLMAEKGVDVIELGMPFSDPVGDGAANQSAAERALRNGDVSLDSIFEMVREFRKFYDTPIVLFTYMNPIYRYGYKDFCVKARDVGVNGVLPVDGPFDMCEELMGELGKADIANIFLCAPTTSDNRMGEICSASKGFVYYISSMGVTGSRDTFSKDLKMRVDLLRKKTDKPIYVGFGISKPESASEISEFSDGIIVGSAIVKIIENYGNDIDALKAKLGQFLDTMLIAIK